MSSTLIDKQNNGWGYGLCSLFLIILVIFSHNTSAISGQAQEPFILGEAPFAPPRQISQSLQQEPTLLSAKSLTFLPIIQRPGSIAVNPQDRTASLRYYQQHYLITNPPSINWTGSQDTCDPGTSNPGFRMEILRRINYFRGMAGIQSEVIFNHTSIQEAQAAALIMSANNNLSHDPPASWKCYTEAGHRGAGSANLALGWYGWDVIDAYMKDPGASNYAVGHRRWILYPQTREMGSGDIPPGNGYPASNALVVFDSHLWEPRPTTREEFISWPPPGYVPYRVIYGRWSFAYPGANFNNAIVRVTSEGRYIPVVQSLPISGYGENTLVWIPEGRSHSENWPRPSRDTAYTVAILNVLVDGAPRSFTYTVMIFDPEL